MKDISFFKIICIMFSMSTPLTEIGKRIQEARIFAKLTQADLGKHLGVQGPTVSKYENGTVDPGAIGLTTIASLAKSSVDWVVTGDGPGPGEIFIAPHHGQSFEADLMREAIIIVRNGEEQTDLKLKPEKAADIALMIYETYVKGEEISQEKVIQLIRLAA